MIAKVRAGATSKSTPDEVAKILNPFAIAIQGEEAFDTSYRNVGGSVAFGQGRIAIGVRMGTVARLRAFSTVSGNSISVPSALDWSLQFDAQPRFLHGGLLVVDGPGIQDAGVRYAYRILFLKPSEKGFQLGRSMRGIWTLAEESDSHLSIDGTMGTVRNIVEPKSFFTDSTTRLFVHETVYEMNQWPFRTRLENFGNSALQAVDNWMAASMVSAKTELQKQFVNAYGKEKQMIESYQERLSGVDSFEVTLKFDKTFVFKVQLSNAKYQVMYLKVD
ncbi:MAG: hypothetical protein H7Y17_02480 [Chlorobia bacterium]|nr:hypothetical protein [Fimbriimonadaceae bacterium]